jgi:hypothetical protein
MDPLCPESVWQTEEAAGLKGRFNLTKTSKQYMVKFTSIYLPWYLFLFLNKIKNKKIGPVII